MEQQIIILMQNHFFSQKQLNILSPFLFLSLFLYVTLFLSLTPHTYIVICRFDMSISIFLNLSFFLSRSLSLYLFYSLPCLSARLYLRISLSRSLFPFNINRSIYLYPITSCIHLGRKKSLSFGFYHICHLFLLCTF